MDWLESISERILSYSDEKQAVNLIRFFKTGKGEYGEGDRFLGIKVPQLRKICDEYSAEFLAGLAVSEEEALGNIRELLHSGYHEFREVALFLLAKACRKSRQRSHAVSAEAEQAIYEFYLSNTEYINNWDLVDLSCVEVVGNHLADKPRNILYRLSGSSMLWEQRISVVSCLAFIRKGEFDDILSISKIFISKGKIHDLMQKAVGWMLREVGKKDEGILKGFLDEYACRMPRTMLRYSIERLSSDDRKHYMTQKHS